jgi:predicted phage terminase large subunit-like protein
MNQPIDADSAVFRQEWIRYYTEPPEVLNYFITIDPAGTTGRESDFTAILVIGIDPDSNIYVLENHQLRQTQQDWMDMVFKLVEKYKIHIDGTVSLETNALQNTYKYAFDLEMEKRKFYFSITESKPAGSNSNKEKRMSALQPFFEQGKIYLKKDMYSLIDQILRFPKSKNDDQLDALKDVLPIMFAPERQKEKPRHETNEKLTRNEKWVWEQFAKETSRKVRRTKYRV